MLAYAIRRILATIPVLFVVAVLIFLLLHLGPSDPAAVIAGDFADPAHIDRIRENLGLDRPLHVQFAAWLTDVLRGDLGTSIFNERSVTELMLQRVEPTLALTLSTITFAVLIGVPFGVIAAWQAGGLSDRLIMMLAVTGFSLPVFVLGYILVYIFSIQLKVLPVQGYTSITEGVVPFLRSIALPTLSLGLIYVALISRMTRASVIEVLNQDYIRTARAKGLSESRVVWVHGMRNAVVPVIQILALSFAALLSGSMVTEVVFSWPGLGRLIFAAVLSRDVPLILGVTAFTAMLVLLGNLLADVLHAVADPRVRDA